MIRLYFLVGTTHEVAMRIVTLGFLLLLCTSSGASSAHAQQPLKSPEEFEDIQDPAQRSRAIFIELGKVLTHPRCLNCHPAGNEPLQGADHHVHFPPAHRAASNVFSDSCSTCHTNRNFTVSAPTTFQSIPGHPRWDLAPLSMAWEGKSLGGICRQIKNKDLNGGRDLALLQEHIAKDDLVGWAWSPGTGREPAPGSQALAGRLAKAWIDAGAECP